MKLKIVILLFYLLGTHHPILAQTSKIDSNSFEIEPVEVSIYFGKQLMLDLTTSSKVIPKKTLIAQNPSNIISAINSTPGVRMEERSPGSYRLAMRGSMIRSPFGVRNSKVYIDEFPLTDASGNTYLNILDPVGIQQIQIMKGPDGSLFGANSAGVLRISPNGFIEPSSDKSVLLQGGSFSTFQQQLSLSHQIDNKYNFSIDQAFLRSDGYRQQTNLSKKFIQTTHQWSYLPQARLRFLALYSDMGYETPGGLTQEQYIENPRQARPGNAAFPGAVEQQAGIYNKTLFSGISNDYFLSPEFKFVVAIFGSYTDLKNPFISNYETRLENNLGYRSFLSYQNNSSPGLFWEMQLGTENQWGKYRIKNYENNSGLRGQLLNDDLLKAGQQTYFYRIKAEFWKRLVAEGSIGLNKNMLSFQQNQPITDSNQGNIDFHNTWMPRVGFSYRIRNELAIRSSVSKGYSPPTVAEIRSSDNRINKDLQPEYGNNYEIGIRFESKNRRFIADLSHYHYQLKDGIIRQLNDSGNEFFTNAGKIKQKGIEASFLGQILKPKSNQFIQNIFVSSNLTFQDYIFQDYKINNNDFSGNKVTSIPEWVWVNSVHINVLKQIDLDLFHNFTSKIPLNDANTVTADSYNLVQAKLGWQVPIKTNVKSLIFFGMDNILNEKYSLGNDINAIGNRYFNPAASRNYFAGIKIAY